MSRGPGRIERAIAAAFDAKPDEAFTTEDLIDVVYVGANRVEKKHRVSLIRAARKVCAASESWTVSRSETTGSTLVFWNRFSVTSYGLMRAKTDMHAWYRSNDARVMDCWKTDADSIRRQLEPGGKYHHHVVEGGAWWRHVQLWIAEQAGDRSERTLKLQEEQDAVKQQFARHADILAAALKRKRGGT
ncbi:hypothetical protein [Aliihoeflea sp. 40Bstr573]|uniref:hypothetical protein n=1 Tax=Aliihoeflea sp. 40Bstr573 TaxID=2696467 RepID=UPI0020956CCF|nr:hypothetical protein [Aliihoeflea sp. 40Bstr573]MCO6386222.1 hypothetical protein [Aliihoeflea sp. 40Bstr573]